MNNVPNNATGTKEKEEMWILERKRVQRRIINDSRFRTENVKAASNILYLWDWRKSVGLSSNC
jgi:hypothetical protein